MPFIILIVSLISALVVFTFIRNNDYFRYEDTQIEENSEIANEQNETKDTSGQDILEDLNNKIEENKDDDLLDDNYFLVSFLDDDGTVLQSLKYKYGSIPYFNGVVNNKVVDNYEYTFVSWNLPHI